MNAAVVLGLCPTGVGVAQSLGRCGIPVWGTDSTRWAPGFRSRWLRSLGQHRPTDDDRLVEKLRRLYEHTGKKPVLYATSDDFLEFIARNDERLRECTLYPVLDSERLSRYINKREFYELCQRVGVQIPETHYFSSVDELRALAPELNYPVIIKPIRVHVWDTRFKGIKALPAQNPQELLTQLRRVERAGMVADVMIQRIVAGSDRDIRIYATYVDRAGDVRYPFSGWKIRQIPPGFGTTAAARAEPDQAFQEHCGELLAALDHRGLCDVEFRRDPATGREFVMEVNPRAGRWYKLVEYSTANLPLVCYNDLCETDVRPPELRQANRWFFVGRDLLSGLYYLSHRDLSLRQWLQDYRGRKSWALWEARDPAPFLLAPIALAGAVWRSFRQRAAAVIAEKRDRQKLLLRIAKGQLGAAGTGGLLKSIRRQVWRRERFVIFAQAAENVARPGEMPPELRVVPARSYDLETWRADRKLSAVELWWDQLFGARTAFLAYWGEDPVHIAWVFMAFESNKYFDLVEGEAMIGPCLTYPWARGRGVYPLVITAVAAQLRKQGVRRIYMVVEEHNAAYIRGVQKAGLVEAGRIEITRMLGTSRRRIAWKQPR